MEIVRLEKIEQLLERIDKEDEPFAFLAGGTDIMPSINLNKFNKEIIFDLSCFEKDFRFIQTNMESVEIGALSCFADITLNKTVCEKIPQLTEALNSIGSRQIRNMGTLAGNIANASPVADSAPVLLTKEAVVNVVNINGERSIPINEYFVDYKKTSLQKNELIKSITIPFNHFSGKYGFRKIAVRPDMAISKVNLAYAIESNGVKFASGGVYKYPIRLKNVERNWYQKLTVDEWCGVLSQDISPISDLRSTKEYRKQVLANIIAELSESFLE